MTTNRFHKAAKDGLLKVLREATRKDCNNKDESGMTPTLWAAFEGHIEALRLLCGRGGEPDKADYFGNTALHLAAARGHKECVTFLVNFGANLYAMDVEGHTAQDLAAMNGRDDILRYLDAAIGKLENNDKKKSKSHKEKAKKDYEKIQKQYQKRQKEADAIAEKELKKMSKEYDGYGEDISTMPHRPSTVLMALKHKMTRSTSHGNLLDEQPRPTYSALVGTVNSGPRGRGAVYKKALASKLRNGTVGRNGPTDDFKVGEVETTGRRSVTSLSGLRRDSEVMYVGTFSAGPQQRGNVANVFTETEEAKKSTLTRSASQPDFSVPAGEDSGIGQEVLLQEPASIFDRPGFGSVAFRRSITATLGALPPTGATGTGDRSAVGENLSIGSAGSLARHAYQPADWNTPHSESSTVTSDEEGEAEESGYASLERFLTAFGLSQYIQKFKDEQIDLDALMLLTESDMKSLGLPLGPYRKLVNAVHERKQALSHPGAMIDTAI
ncbi:Usher syndrome type-1G protein homolog [Hyposmocoma kahamanoa]|uniref:Usher syndrome type-1G protein homolog n=1 Tax=Hyposmocoma kahamanoa TaxID=1477025 RepID=UPI000E6D632F|nr:Usher syndrome type-1G protein homolog [Hyposmocoma kahamanoa]